MQPRLMRSRSEKILGGVCGGLGEYFALDPVVVRLIFVLSGVTLGVGFLLYPILWVIMPEAPEGTPSIWQYPRLGSADQQTFQAQQPDYVHQEAQGRQGATPQTGSTPRVFRYDPMTGEKLAEPETMFVPPPTPRHAMASGRSGRVIGITILAVGMMLAGQIFGFNAEFVFPVLMIAAGILLLRRK